MVKAELIKRSPLRVFEQSIHGGLGRGNIGVLASPKGVGKTACLVHITPISTFNELWRQKLEQDSARKNSTEEGQP